MMEGMAGLDGVERPWQCGGATGARRAPSADDGQALKALERYGDPSAGEVRLPSRPESAAIARRLTRCVVLRVWSLGPQAAEDAVLLVSELVANAVLHTGAREVGLRMYRLRGGRIRVEVRDPSRGLPCLMPARGTDVGGRGLRVVDELSERWGVDLLPRGKSCWFELRVVDR
ncbi:MULTISPECIES: ATP-binding protein [Streptomyces]|uniref:ATP-binding protein n=1 Tax=Streptomyces sudanensis TaxID=436397 RepID=A0ABY4TAB7_9ACTN|nr:MULTISPECIES: ATP-binding protein [Streptomyces]MCP9986354.1 ATP-binding protein [Streptomyces sudanensis]URN14888.1 ATP-binding protein [Streptomyces sudanensis]